ncbi:MAG: biopolymer transporter ExbD [Saprospiraceae bacterium]|nr:biopolymer transporter ExbD [Saprospiraceae bacterium]
MANRKIPEINAGSMADIAFLLLVFFLVTTTIQTDSGLRVLLPPYVPEDQPVEIDVQKRNVLAVQVNARDQLLVRDNIMKIEDLREYTKVFITSGRPDMAKSPKQAIVSLLNDNGTSYKMYLSVYNELRAAYNELWEDRAQNDFGRAYDALSKQEQKKVREEIPLVISEAEPTGN